MRDFKLAPIELNVRWLWRPLGWFGYIAPTSLLSIDGASPLVSLNLPSLTLNGEWPTEVAFGMQVVREHWSHMVEAAFSLRGVRIIAASLLG